MDAAFRPRRPSGPRRNARLLLALPVAAVISLAGCAGDKLSVGYTNEETGATVRVELPVGQAPREKLTYGEETFDRDE